MINVVDRYFSLNRTLLLIVGLWPYQKSILARLQSFCCFGTIVTFIIFQFTTFMTTKCTTDDIIKICSLSFTIICLAVKFNSFYINSDAVKFLLEELQHVYNNIKDNNEIAIMDRFGDIAKRYTTALIIYVSFSAFVIGIAQLLPDLINVILPANKSRSHRLLVPVEYFIDQEKYHYLLLFHITAGGFISLAGFVSISSLLFTFLLLICGIFKIASYRIKKTIGIYIQSFNLKDKNLAYNDLIYGINIHRKGIWFSEYLLSKLETTFMLLIAFGVIASSLNMFRILTSQYITEEFPVTFIVASICFMYMFFSNFIGQEVRDHYGLIFTTAYKTQWYITPPCIQKLILFLLLRGNKSYDVNIGGLFIASLQGFTTLANASLSYFIVMHSMQ